MTMRIAVVVDQASDEVIEALEWLLPAAQLTPTTVEDVVARGRESYDLAMLIGDVDARSLRQEPIPLLVCGLRPVVELGMSSGDPKAGEVTGTTTLWSTSDEPDTVATRIADLSEGAAWASPSSSAISVATAFPDRPHQSTVFRYAKGDWMIEDVAPADRTALLLDLQNARKLSRSACQLVWSTLAWAAGKGPAPEYGDTASEPVAAGGQTLRETLGDKEYQEWVHDRVSRKIFLRLGAVGVAGMIAVASLAFQGVKSIITQRVDTSVQSRTAAVERTIPGVVAKTLIDQVLVQEEVEKIALQAATEATSKVVAEETKPDKIRELVQKAVEDKDLLEVLVDAAATQIEESGGIRIQKLLLEELRPDLVDPRLDPNQRVQVLRLLVIFEPEQIRLNEAILDLLGDEHLLTVEIVALALRAFEATTADPVTDETLAAALALLGSPEYLTDATRETFADFIGRLPSGYAPKLRDWIVSREEASVDQEVVALGLSRIGSGNESLEALTDLATSNDAEHQRLGFAGLSLIRRTDFDDTIRREQLTRLWERVKSADVNDTTELFRDDSSIAQLARRLYTAVVTRDYDELERINPPTGSAAGERLIELRDRCAALSEFEQVESRFPSVERMLYWVNNGREQPAEQLALAGASLAGMSLGDILRRFGPEITDPDAYEYLEEVAVRGKRARVPRPAGDRPGVQRHHSGGVLRPAQRRRGRRAGPAVPRFLELRKRAERRGRDLGLRQGRARASLANGPDRGPPPLRARRHAAAPAEPDESRCLRATELGPRRRCGVLRAGPGVRRRDHGQGPEGPAAVLAPVRRRSGYAGSPGRRDPATPGRRRDERRGGRPPAERARHDRDRWPPGTPSSRRCSDV